MQSLNMASNLATNLAGLLAEIDALRDAVERDAEKTLARWNGWIVRPDYAPSARNFAHYLALRHHDIRPLQRRLMRFGLSSLGRVEGKVMPALDALRNVLRLASGSPALGTVLEEEFFAGEARIAARAEAMFGPLSHHSAVRMMVTLPSVAADEPGFIERLAEQGVEAVRINCAHDDAAA